MPVDRRHLSLVGAKKSITSSDWPEADLSGLRVMLINPPQTYPEMLQNEYQSYWPVGLAMIASVLERAGASVSCVDCLAYDTRSRRVTDGAIRFGMPAPRLRDEIAAQCPDVVGITNPFTHFIDDAAWTARLVKQVDPAIQVIMGGIEPSLPSRSTQLLERNPQLDVLVRGEGELTVVELLSRFEPATRAFRELASVAGLVFRGEGGIISTRERGFLKELDSLPLPAYHLFDIDRMYDNRYYALNRGRKRGVRCLPIHTSRGCPYSCNFCSVHSQVGKAHRRHSTAYVRRHLEAVIERYGVRHVHFEDDNLTLHHDHSLEFFRAIEDLNITWDTPNGTRADSMSCELARAMARAGAKTISIAVESGNQTVLEKIVRKRLDLSHVVDSVRHLYDAGLPTIVFFVLGFPGETEQDIRDTLRFGRRLAVEYDTVNLLFVATPLPDTDLERQCMENGYLVAGLDNESLLASIRLNQAALIQTREFSKAELYEWAREELDIAPLHTIGKNIPMFFSTSPRAIANVKEVMGFDFGDTLPVSYWAAPPKLGKRGLRAHPPSESCDSKPSPFAEKTL